MNDNGAPGPQARVEGSWERSVRGRLKRPPQADLLTGLPAGSPKLGTGEQPPDFPTKGEESAVRQWLLYIPARKRTAH